MKKFSAVFFVIAAMAAAAQAQTPQTTQLPPGAGRDLINERCVSCHPVSTITAQRKDAMGWAVTLQQMADRGAEVSPEEMATIIEYLARTLPAQSDGQRARAGNAQQGG